MSSHPTKVLVVDDDPIDRERLVRLVSATYPHVEQTEAETIAEARRALRSETFDCVLVDYQLGDATGAELLDDVTGHRTEICPVILVTLHDSDQLIVEAIRSGFSDYIAKPSLDVATLRRVVDEAMARATADEKRRGDEVRFRTLANSIQRDYEHLLIATADRAKELSQSKSLFLANMSHEIRTPLNTVIGLSQLLERTPLSEDQADIVSKIRTASRTLMTTVNDVLDRTKLDAREMTLEHVPYTPAEILADLRTLIEPLVGNRITLEINSDEALPPRLLGDPWRLHRILLNLLSNAAKFTEQGSIRLEAGTDAAGERLVVRVTDTGMGIPAHLLDTLFEPFVQADNRTTRKVGGTGLGLSISRDLARLMGGDITVASAMGEGSTFTLDLPLHRHEAEAEPPVPVKASGEPRLAGLRILVVDDCDINLEVATRILEMEGATVATSINGHDAAKFAIDAQSAIDVILMDLQMPVLDGRDAFRRIEAVLGRARPVVIALTAGVSAGDFGTLDIAGMDGLVSKPFDIDRLVAIVRRKFEQGPGASEALRRSDDALADCWPEIACIDIADVRTRLGDDVELFRSILRQLLDDYHDIAWLSSATSRQEQSQRLSLLRASAALVGAVELSNAAGRAAEVANRGALLAEPEQLSTVCAEMSRLQSESAAFLEGDEFPHATSRETDTSAQPPQPCPPRRGLDLVH